MPSLVSLLLIPIVVWSLILAPPPPPRPGRQPRAPTPTPLPMAPLPGPGSASSLVPGLELNPFATLFPELLRSPAPSWLREGTRVSYRVMSATIAQLPDESGGGGGGVGEYDVVAIDQGTVVSTLKLYLDTGNQGLVPNLIFSSFGRLGVGDYWVHPSVLRNAERVANDDLAVLHMPTTIAGRAYQAVRFEHHRQDAVTVWMFDEATGILLYYRHSVGSELDPRRQITIMELLGQRQKTIPWQADAVPAWVARGGVLRYTGGTTVWITGQPTSPLPYAVTVQMGRSYNRWSEFQLSDSTTVGPVPSRVTGVAQLFDNLWLPAAALTVLRSGRARVLDEDPITGARITAERSADGAIVLTEAGAAYRVVTTYDSRTGMLLGIHRETPVGVGAIVVDVWLAGEE